jgi:carboxylesterase type B
MKLPTTDSNLLPVMVWIHGGGFTTGSNSSDIYGPEFLITSNVVIVVINYRLGLLGFLSIDDPSLGIPGNAGFKDMIMALKWVQNNIQQFSGDSNNVTVFGESAAGGAVHLLMLSPMSRGLFHKAIAQSGCALNPWSRAKRFDRKMYDVFDYNESSNENIAEYLRNLPVEKLLECQFKMGYFLDVNRMNPFGLVIEREFAEQGEVPFLTEDPVDVILSKNFMDVPLMIGFTKMEGLLVHTYRPTAYENMLKDFEANVPHLLGYKTGTNESKAVAEKIKSFYFGDEDPAQNKNQFYEMVTDNLFLYGIYSTVKKHSFNSTSPVYFYRLSLETSLKFLQVLMKDKEEGAAHGDDVAYLFKNIFNKPLLRDTLEYTSVKCIVKLWTNFAYYGNPTPDNNSTLIWEKVNKKQVGFLDIGNELTFFNDLQQTSLQFWDKIYEESSQGYKFSCRNPTLLKKCKGRL